MSDVTPQPVSSGRPELTGRVIVLGLILAVVMGAANVYVGLKAGMTVSASIPAAVMAMLLFRLLFKNSSILEANQVQTCASAGESLAAGIIFTMPAMILIGYWQEFDFWTITAIAFTGGLLGILFMIPMRKVFVVDNDELAYPEGVACASVLEAGEADGQDDAATALVVGGLVGALVKVVGGLFGLIAGSLETARLIGGRIFYFGGDLSPMLVAVGFIVRLNVAILIFMGGAISWLIGIPLLGFDGEAATAAEAAEAAGDLWSSKMRYVGVGAMVLGGFASLISVRAGLWAAIQHLIDGFAERTDDDDTSRDIPSLAIFGLGAICIALLAGINYYFASDIGVTVLATGLMLVLGFFFTAVASYIVGLVGNSNSPVSGMTITAVLVAGGMLYLFQYTGTNGMVATLGIAGIVCCIACTSGDVCNDLKTGSLVGASPFRQQIMQILGVGIASLVMAPVLTLLHTQTPGGIGGDELAAPQAQLFASLAKGFFGEATPENALPWDFIGWGVGVGLVILVIDWFLKKNDSSFRMYLMPIAVGMYLPFGLAVPILVGGLIAYLYSRGVAEQDTDRVLHRGILFSSGVIAGEALTAVGLAMLAVFGIKRMEFASEGLVSVLSIAAAIGIVFVFAIFTRPSRQEVKP